MISFKKIIYIFLILVLTISVYSVYQNQHIIKFIAHRGAFKGYGTQENSIEAFDAAYKSGYNYIEFDIRFIDDTPYISHDSIRQSTNLGDLNTLKDVVDWSMDKNVVLVPEIKDKLNDYDLEVFNNTMEIKDKNEIIVQSSIFSNTRYLENKDYPILILPFGEYSDYSIEDLISLSKEKNYYIGFNYHELSKQDLNLINKSDIRDIYWTIDEKSEVTELQNYTPLGIMTNEKLDYISAD